VKPVLAPIITTARTISTEVQRQTRMRLSLLPPDLLETWLERALAIVAVGIVAWTIFDIVRGM
jgi:hypothetical protein